MKNFYLLLIGDPGTGKSIFLRELQEWLDEVGVGYERLQEVPKDINPHPEHCLKLTPPE